MSLPVPEDGGHEQRANDKDSGVFADDTTVIDSAPEQPTIKQVANVDTNAIPNDDEVVSDGFDVLLPLTKIKLHQGKKQLSARCVIVLWDPNVILPEVSSEDSNYDDQAESNSDGDTNELPTQAKQGAKGTKAPPPPVRQCTLPADDAPACPPA
ncbi:hypothetical protein K503DRAFT_786721 [Rhizopogon vinicolor AM-OR11-026]|uniref:Uncharacterized protein n=1 Tax=Rhizopogon vinicolor AM-OR11-026 TaxID=1314800 RepID=A0A1B7MKM7_9AGAM|nr:hypothetical protein K503DRAFT_786721 [Rhizopogon vinicolor AM-OR11-026]